MQLTVDGGKRVEHTDLVLYERSTGVHRCVMCEQILYQHESIPNTISVENVRERPACCCCFELCNVVNDGVDNAG